MIFLKPSLFAIFIFHAGFFSVFSQAAPCEGSFSAGSVFVNFAKKHLGENQIGKMGRDWESKIEEATRSWSQENAMEFLDFLTAFIGIENTIQNIKATSYFKSTNYESFMSRVTLYEEYIKTEGVIRRLSRSLNGFQTGEINEIKAVVEYVEKYIGIEATKQLMINSLQVFSTARLSKLKRVVKYMERYIGVKATKQLMKKSFWVFVKVNLSHPESVVKYMESYIGRTATVVDALPEKMTKQQHDLLVHLLSPVRPYGLLSPRQVRILQNNHIEFIWELVQQTKEELLQLTNFGQQSLEKLRIIISPLEFGLLSRYAPHYRLEQQLPFLAKIIPPLTKIEGKLTSQDIRRVLLSLLGTDKELTNQNIQRAIVLTSPINTLVLSAHSENALNNDGIQYILELVRKTERELLQLTNFGRKNLNEIKKALSRFDLYLGMDNIGGFIPPKHPLTGSRRFFGNYDIFFGPMNSREEEVLSMHFGIQREESDYVADIQIVKRAFGKLLVQFGKELELVEHSVSINQQRKKEVVELVFKTLLSLYGDRQQSFRQKRVLFENSGRIESSPKKEIP